MTILETKRAGVLTAGSVHREKHMFLFCHVPQSTEVKHTHCFQGLWPYHVLPVKASL